MIVIKNINLPKQLVQAIDSILTKVINRCNIGTTQNVKHFYSRYTLVDDNMAEDRKNTKQHITTTEPAIEKRRNNIFNTSHNCVFTSPNNFTAY